MANVTLPQLGETVTEGTITKWFKKVGDAVAADEPLFEVSTDKVDTEVPSPVAGVLTEIKANEGDTVPVGAVIAVVGDADAAPAPAPAAAPASAAAPVPEPAPAPAPAPAPVAKPAPAPAPTPGGAPLLSPVVRRLIAENNLDAAAIKGTGPGGRITREDVLAVIDAQGGKSAPAPAAAAPATPAAAAAPAPAPAAKPASKKEAGAVSEDGREKRIKLSKIRKLTGEHMVMSKSVSPHTFSVVEVDYANVDRAR
ncbi:MAG: biotin/lipoyl-containing protein, partial [Actinomycetota bacterium]